jgi:hypothetical protein
MIFMSEQYVKPETLDSLVHIDEGNVIQVLETIIKLAIPNTLIWLIVNFFSLKKVKKKTKILLGFLRIVPLLPKSFR